MSFACHFCYKEFDTEEELDDHLFEIHPCEATDSQIMAMKRASANLCAEFCAMEGCRHCVFYSDYICPAKRLEAEIREQEPLAEERRKGEAWYQHMKDTP